MDSINWLINCSGFILIYVFNDDDRFASLKNVHVKFIIDD